MIKYKQMSNIYIYIQYCAKVFCVYSMEDNFIQLLLFQITFFVFFFIKILS